MSEVEALEKIASAIEHLAVAVGCLGTVAWLTLFFKSQSADSSINHLAEVLEKWLAK
jgi:hypothetical protein